MNNFPVIFFLEISFLSLRMIFRIILKCSIQLCFKCTRSALFETQRYVLHRIKWHHVCCTKLLLSFTVYSAVNSISVIFLQGGTGFASCGVELHARESRPVMQVWWILKFVVLLYYLRDSCAFCCHTFSF